MFYLPIDLTDPSIIVTIIVEIAVCYSAWRFTGNAIDYKYGPIRMLLSLIVYPLSIVGIPFFVPRLTERIIAHIGMFL